MTDDLDAIADELYTLRPDEFAAARDARVREARQAGNAELARGLGQLRRPTQSAWLINLLWRDQRDTMDQLLELGAELSRAQAQASGTELRTLMQQRREVESALLQRARSLARERGVDVSAATEREAQETLAAALAEPSVAEEIRSGRLLKPTAYAGFGTPIVAPSVAARSAPAAAADELAERRARRAAQPREEKAEEPRSEAEREAAQELERVRERRAEAERQLQRAHGMANTAEAELEARTREAETARQHEAELARRVEQLQTQLRQLEQQLDAAGQSAR
ncbi:MAG: hypothetical protein JOZ81_03140, partial [Chloroflexi bacterium]|nr:hypothetical protein [Chloroflexota bacterium]